VTRDAEEFRRIHDEYRPKVFRHLARMLGDGEAEDLTQAVMLRVSDGLAQFRGDASLSTWIYRIATNAAIDRRRSAGTGGSAGTAPEASVERGPEPGETSPAPVELRTPSTEAQALRREMSTCIRDYVERLPEKYRKLALLSELEGLRNAEIAAVLGVSVAAVKIGLHRARRRLRRDLQAGCSFSRDAGSALVCERKPPVRVERRS
jgi:RNA polymerase sigma-70 factor, ECF subfamily